MIRSHRPSGSPSPLASAAPLALLATLAACGGSIRVVDQTPTQGELALMGPRREARAAAETHMSSHCPEGYRVLNDGKTAVRAPRPPDIGAPEGRVGVKGTDPDEVEWRIRYQCDGERAKSGPPKVDARDQESR
ncbi:MAG TPA: hypothetical protein VFS43_14675 [Polyangiaceae bacterium]|nr:hypothetical protein [Polyangiaceae bacterium]